jgi:hypothetical protein
MNCKNCPTEMFPLGEFNYDDKQWEIWHCPNCGSALSILPGHIDGEWITPKMVEKKVVNRD